MDRDLVWEAIRNIHERLDALSIWASSIDKMVHQLKKENENSEIRRQDTKRDLEQQKTPKK